MYTVGYFTDSVGTLFGQYISDRTHLYYHDAVKHAVQLASNVERVYSAYDYTIFISQN